MSKPKTSKKPAAPPAEPTPAAMLDLAEGATPAQRVAAAMKTGNHDLVARVRRELGV